MKATSDEFGCAQKVKGVHCEVGSNDFNLQIFVNLFDSLTGFVYVQNRRDCHHS
jgi:hypothetical protein